MRWAARVARVGGVPVRVHATFALLVLLLLAYSVWRLGWRATLWELAFLVLLFLCVVLHELAHTVVALARGVPITGITLYPFGGVSELGARPQGGTEVGIALAGPASNLAIAACLLVATAGKVPSYQPGASLAGVIGMLFWANLILALFNLLPAFPLDGGRILRGLLARRLGVARATTWAGALGQIAGIVFIAWGVARDPWLALVGVIVLLGATAELQRTQGLRRLQSHRVRDAMVRQLETVAPHATLQTVAEWWREVPLTDFAVVENERVVGYLPAARLWTSLRQRGDAARVADVMSPVGEPLDPDTPLLEALEGRETAPGAALPVVDDDGGLVGMITPERVARTLALLRALSGTD